jgi:hypothetical protein
VLRKRLTVGTVPGAYRCAASMGQTASPAAGRANFHVLARTAAEPLEATIFGTGLDAPTLDWLGDIGIHCDGDVAQAGPGDVVVVGHPAEVPDPVWGHLRRVTSAGATAVVLDAGQLIPDASSSRTGFTTRTAFPGITSSSAVSPLPGSWTGIFMVT